METTSQRYEAYLKTDYWKAISDRVKAAAGYRCQVCNSQHDLQAHHRTYEHRGKELEHLSDLTCLCRRCHGIFHGTIVAVSAPAQVPAPRRVMDEADNYEGPKTSVRPHTQADIDREMPNDGSTHVLLNKVLVNRLRANGSFTSATMRALGVAIPPSVGWTQRLYGMRMSLAAYRLALEGKYIYAKGRFIP